MDVAKSWKRIEKWLKSNAPSIGKSFRPASKDGAIEKLQQQIGVSLPSDVAESIRLHDGQKSDAEHGLFPHSDDVLGPMPSFRLMPVSEIASAWRMMKDLLEGGDFDGQQSEPAPGIRNDWWHTAWIPIADNGGGDFFCIDLSPAQGGTIGQVIVFFHDMKDRPFIAKSYEAWLNQLAEGLESGQYLLDEEEGIVVAEADE
jgi:cell wall assembly regulator SMI1